MDSEANQRIGAAIRSARLAKGITQDDLARMLNVERATISRYEQGTRPVPAEMISRLSTYLHTPVYQLLPDAFGFDATVSMVVEILSGNPALAGAVMTLLQHQPVALYEADTAQEPANVKPGTRRPTPTTNGVKPA